MKKYWLLVIVLFLVGCASSDDELDKKILSPENVSIYDIKVDDIMPEINNGKKLLKGFPFVSYRPVIDFNGKFSYQFYDRIDYRYKYSKLQDVDFWKLRTNPFLDDFIYVLPIWVDDFKKVSRDLFTNIAYSYNLSSKEQEILKWWIAQGGILWIEDGIYSTRYDTFKRNGEIDERAIKEKIYSKAKGLRFLNRHINTYGYLAKKIDLINYKPLEVTFKTKSNIKYFKDIKNVKLTNYNYLSLYFMPKGKVLLKDSHNRPLVTFIQFGRGGIANLRDFEFEDKRFDGELLRWKLLSYFLDKKYLKHHKRINLKKESVVLHLNFKYKSYKLTRRDKFLIEPMIKYLKQNSKMQIKIIGHTDSIGSDGYNYILSLKRAKSVRDYLVKNGISKDRLIVEGKGERNPIATNMVKAGRAKNRRVEFVLVK
jgi:hypothetical protein